MSEWTDEVRARMVREEERLRYKAANLQARGKTVMAAQELAVADDIRAALGEIERQKRLLATEHESGEQCRVVLKRAEAAKAKLTEAHNLLAVMHRDGGHHTADVGFEQSCKDAMQVRHDLVAEVERLRGLLDDALACDPAIRPVEWVEWRERAALRGGGR